MARDTSTIVLGGGGRSKNGCINCRKLKRKCDGIKPTCKGCQRRAKPCVWPSNERFTEFVILDGSGYFLLSDSAQSKRQFMSTASSTVGQLCPQYDQQVNGLSYSHAEPLAPVLLPSLSSFVFSEIDDSARYPPSQMVQYYYEVVSNSRVYVPTGFNSFRALVLPFVMRSQGPLYFAVLAIGAAERSAVRTYPSTPDYTEASTYKVKALQALQQSLSDADYADEVILTCILLASLEIASGSNPVWIKHGKGAMAVARSYRPRLSPHVLDFALRYFWFRYTLLETTRSGASFQSAHPDLEAEEKQLLETVRSDELCGDLDTNIAQVVDKHLGCSLNLVGLISQVSKLASVLAQPNPPSDRDRHDEIARTTRSLQRVRFISYEPDAAYLISSAECFKIAAQIYLKLVTSDTLASDHTFSVMCEHLLFALRTSIIEDQPRRSFPMWPLFMAACVCLNDEQRTTVLSLFEILDSKWPISNIKTVKKVVCTVWQSRDLNSPDATYTPKDWQDIINRFGWKLSLS